MANTDFLIQLGVMLNQSEVESQVQKSLTNVQKALKLDVSDIKGVSTTFKDMGDGVLVAEKSLTTYEDAMGKVTKVTTNGDGEVVKFSESMKKASAETTDTKKSLGQFTDELTKNTAKFISWSIITTAYFAALKGLKDVIDEVKELDDAMLELSKVTELSTTELSEFASEAAEVGKEINATAAEIVNASAEFSRMGFSSDVSMQLAEDAVVLTKIADGITDVTDASTAMISILKGFNLEASESEHIIDSINEVSNNFAISTDDLADGLSRAGGTLAQSNTSLEETIGLLTAGNESLQNIEKVSSGLEIKLAPYVRNVIRKFRERYCSTVYIQRLGFIG